MKKLLLVLLVAGCASIPTSQRTILFKQYHQTAWDTARFSLQAGESLQISHMNKVLKVSIRGPQGASNEIWEYTPIDTLIIK